MFVCLCITLLQNFILNHIGLMSNKCKNQALSSTQGDSSMKLYFKITGLTLVFNWRVWIVVCQIDLCDKWYMKSHSPKNMFSCLLQNGLKIQMQIALNRLGNVNKISTNISPHRVAEFNRLLIRWCVSVDTQDRKTYQKFIALGIRNVWRSWQIVIQLHFGISNGFCWLSHVFC